tara:strand:+ start:231 stop:479 length:249 start_codon:yes stop_codon:yes gene_type:complete
MAKFLEIIHPENRTELAYGDLDAVQKDMVRYLNNLSDDHIVALCNHFGSSQCSFDPNFVEQNPLKEWIESTDCYKYQKGELV